MAEHRGDTAGTRVRDGRGASRRLLGRTRRLISTFLAVALVATSGLLVVEPATVAVAGEQVPCGYGLLCGPADIEAAPIRVWEPWDRIIQPNTPAENAAGERDASIEWAGLEAEARVAVAALRGVPNDRRIVENAREDVLAYMYHRLISILKRQANGESVTAEERIWTDHLRRELGAQDVDEALASIAEYDRWHSSPCSYQPPSGFGFARYATAGCADTGLGSTTIPPPPTAEQFAAYGAALAQEPASRGPDVDAAWARAGQTILMLSVLAVGLSYAAVLAELIALSPELALAIVNAVGSNLAHLTYVTGAGGGTFAANQTAIAAFAAGAAITTTLVIAVAAAVTIAGTWREIATAEVPVKLNKWLADAQENLPTPAEVVETEASRTEAFAALFAEASPSFEAERAAASSPSSHDPVKDPEWLLPNGTRTAELRTISWDGLVQRTYITDGWLVTSKDFGPYEWTSTLQFRGAGGGLDEIYAQGNMVVFNRSPRTTSEARSVVSTDRFVIENVFGDDQTVQVVGNRAPRLAVEVEQDPQEGTPFRITSGATDPDGEEVTVRWLLQPENDTALIKGCVDATYTTVQGVECAWLRASGETIDWRWGDQGRYFVRVFAIDPHGATTEQRFDIVVGNVAPTLTVAPTTTVAEGDVTRITGSFSDQGDDPIRLRIDWGDGTTEFTTKFPCLGSFDSNGSCTGASDVLDGADDPTTWFATHRYVGPPPASGGYDVVVRVDDGVATTSATVRQAVVGTPITVEALSASASAEGGSSIVSGRIRHPARDAFRLEVDPGDGTAPIVANYPCPAGTACVITQTPPDPGTVCLNPCELFWFAVSHSYADGPSTPTVRVRASRGEATSSTRTTTATVTNAAPAIGLNPSSLDPDPTSALTGQEVVLRGFVRDPGNDAGVLTVRWGDGEPAEQYSYPCSGDGCVFSTTRPYTDVCPFGGCDVGRLFFTVRHRYTSTSGPDGFRVTFDAADEDGASAVQRSRTMTVRPAPHMPPDALATTVSTLEDRRLDVSLAEFVVDDLTPDDALRLTITDRPDHGTLTIDGLNVSYVPDANWYGTDGFSYQVTDTGSPVGCGAATEFCLASLTSAESSVTINVRPVNDAPSVVLSGPTSVLEGSTANYAFTVQDPDLGDVIGSPSPTVECGAVGVLVPGSIVVSSSSGSFSCRFPDGPSSSSIRVSLVDVQGAAGGATRDVAVSNVAPTITLDMVQPARPVLGEGVTIQALISDPGDDVATMTFDSGEGIATSPFQVAPGRYAVIGWIWRTPGRYLATLRATDDGASSTLTIPLEILGGGPALDEIARRLAALPRTGLTATQSDSLQQAIDRLRGPRGGAGEGAADLVATQPVDAMDLVVTAMSRLATVPGTEITAMRDRLSLISQGIARDEIARGKARTGCLSYTARGCTSSEARRLQAAEAALATGDASLALRRYDDAVGSYRTAVSEAVKA